MGAGATPPIPLQSALSLNSFDRAARMATLFRWYKCEKVEYTYQPIFNTYQASSTGYSIPYLYHVMNRTGTQDVYDVNDFKAMGSMPHRLSKPLKITYKPNWLLAGNAIVNYQSLTIPGYSSTVNAGVFPIANSGNTPCSKWLRCPAQNTAGPAGSTSSFDEVGLSASVLSPFPLARSLNETAAVQWLGHDIIVDQDVPAPVDVPLVRVMVKVHWVFKDPMYYGVTVPSLPQTREQTSNV
jgi:hypothetical protein